MPTSSVTPPARSLASTKMQVATRVVVLDRGSVLADGEPRTVMRDPAVVRAYLGRAYA